MLKNSPWEFQQKIKQGKDRRYLFLFNQETIDYICLTITTIIRQIYFEMIFVSKWGLYLAGILDTFSRKIVEGVDRGTLNPNSVTEALEKAFRKEKPGRGLIFPLDWGSQYDSHAFQDFLGGYGFAPSMSSSGIAITIL